MKLGEGQRENDESIESISTIDLEQTIRLEVRVFLSTQMTKI